MIVLCLLFSNLLELSFHRKGWISHKKILCSGTWRKSYLLGSSASLRNFRPSAWNCKSARLSYVECMWMMIKGMSYSDDNSWVVDDDDNVHLGEGFEHRLQFSFFHQPLSGTEMDNISFCDHWQYINVSSSSLWLPIKAYKSFCDEWQSSSLTLPMLSSSSLW